MAVLKAKAKVKNPDEPVVKKNRFGHEHIKDFTSAEMVEILNHPATTKYIITGKGYGKNRAIALKTLAFMEQDFRAQGLMLKKYSGNAQLRLEVDIINLSLELQRAGFDIPEYKHGDNVTYRMESKKTYNSPSNGTIEYASFENTGAVAGIKAKNNGYFPLVEVDEPVEGGKDRDKVPPNDEWKMIVSTLIDSVARSNTSHMSIFGREVQPTQFYFTMNPWADHPIIVEAEQFLPEEEFKQFFMKDLINNHTMWRYVPEYDILVARGTKFGNSQFRAIEIVLDELGITSAEEMLEKMDDIDYEDERLTKVGVNRFVMKSYFKAIGAPRTLLVQAREAIKNDDKLKLAQILGLKYESEEGTRKTYDLEALKKEDTDKLIKNMSSRLIISWDIDQRNGGRFVATPVWTTLKQSGAKVVKNIVVGKQIIVPSLGIRSDGSNIDVYANKMAQVTNDIILKFTQVHGRQMEPLILMDDNGKHWIRLLSQRIYNSTFKPTSFKNANNWKILVRQNWLQSAIDSGYLIIDKDNHMLLNDLNKSYCREGNDQRDESGAQRNLYDTINSMEYGLYAVRGQLAKDYDAGSIENYTHTT